jgi:thioredoxin-like negative regulator of GroEL
MRLLSLALFILLPLAVFAATSTALETFLKGSKKPAVIKFYADWCESCKDYAPTYSKVQAAQNKQLDFYSVDVDDKLNAKLIKQLKISRIPVTYFVTKDRKTISKKMGPLAEQDLTTSVKKLLIP